MNTKTRKNLVVALGAALFAGSMLSTAAAAQESEFQAYAKETRASVLAEVTEQPDTGERLHEMRKTLEGALVVAGLDGIPAQGEDAIASIREQTLSSFRSNASSAIGLTLAQAHVRPMQVAEVNNANQSKNDWSLPEVEIKPLIDMNFLLFSFRK